MTRSGRRPGNPDTRDAILKAARTLFADKGFVGASMRQIAAEAGVDAALIHHYFTSKDQLFLATIQVPVDIRATIGRVAIGPPEEFGTRLITTLLQVWDSDAGPSLVAAFRAAISDPTTSRLVREFVTTTIFGVIAGAMHMAPDEAPRRSALIGSQMIGLIVGRYLLALEPLAAIPAEQLVVSIAPTVQRYLTGPLGE